MKYLNDIKKNIYDTQTEITNEEIKRNDIQDAYILANKINTFIDRLRNISTSFEPANGFIKDTTSNDPEERKISYVYKQWNEEIFIKDGVEDYIDIILPMIHFQILYKFPSTTDLSYYNCMEDLQEVFFYEVKDETTIIDDAIIEGTIIEQVNRTLEFVKKHLTLEFKITGKPRREEIWEYPLDALREAVINAVCHRDYTEPSDIQIRIYNDELIVWSSGKLPLGITLEELYKLHRSVLRNKLIAQVFFDIDFIERWGSGISRIIQSCLAQGLPEPKFEEYQGFRVIFRKDIYTEEYLKDLGLNERQVKSVMFTKKEGKIANKKYQELFNVSRQTATRELSDLTQKSIFRQVGVTGKGTFYTLVQTPHKRLINAPKINIKTQISPKLIYGPKMSPKKGNKQQ